MTRGVYLQRYGKDDLVIVDGSRIAASVVSGIGFLARGAISQIVSALLELGATAAEVEYERRLDKKRVTVAFDVRFLARSALSTLIERLESQPGVRRIHVQAPG